MQLKGIYNGFESSNVRWERVFDQDQMTELSFSNKEEWEIWSKAMIRLISTKEMPLYCIAVCQVWCQILVRDCTAEIFVAQCRNGV